MYVIFYDGNKIMGRGHYKNVKQIPRQYSYVEVEEELFNKKIPLEIFEEDSKKQIRINNAKKIEREKEEQEYKKLKQKAMNNEALSNSEHAKFLILNKKF